MLEWQLHLDGGLPARARPWLLRWPASPTGRPTGAGGGDRRRQARAGVEPDQGGGGAPQPGPGDDNPCVVPQQRAVGGAVTVEAGSLAAGAVLVLACWATLALCVSAVVAVVALRRQAPGERWARSAYRVECPSCGAGPRRVCVRMGGTAAPSAHTVRTAAASGFVVPGEGGAW